MPHLAHTYQESNYYIYKVQKTHTATIAKYIATKIECNNYYTKAAHFVDLKLNTSPLIIIHEYEVIF